MVNSSTRKLSKKTVGNTVYWLPKVTQWRWALKEAFNSMGLLTQTSVDFVRLPTRIVCPSTYMYSRAYGGRDVDKKEMFESFRSGTVLTFNVFILSSLEQSNIMINFPQRPPTVEETVKAFSIIGEDIGLSPWGSKFDYGRFTVVSPGIGQDAKAEVGKSSN